MRHVIKSVCSIGIAVLLLLTYSPILDSKTVAAQLVLGFPATALLWLLGPVVLMVFIAGLILTWEEDNT
jgi:hypothetical protein